MVKLSSMKTIAVAGFMALALSAGAGVASAAPDTSALINTTCSYDQIVAAVNAEVPDEASGINNSGMLQGLLRDFLAAPASGRESMLSRAMSNPFVQDDVGAMAQVAGSCNRY